MKIEFNHNQLAALLGDFYNCTKIPVSLFDTQFRYMYASIEKPAYCEAVYNAPGLESACDICDQKHFSIVNETKSVLFYSCHAGICEVITPIMYEGIVIAYLMLGRFRDRECVYSSTKSVRAFAKKNALDEKTMLEAYRQLPVFSHDEIYSSVNVLQSIIPFIWTENLISAHKDLLPQKIENYINQNLTSSTLTVEKLCQTFFISKRTLYNIFHREFHDTLRSYIINKRLTLAKKMLLDTNLPISEISENCGFNDYNYFSRVFHLRYGMAPSRFRKKANSSPPREMSLKNERPFRLRQNTARQSSRSMRYNILRIGHGLQAMSA